jgi:deoxyribodipyrimidine photo-lyase
VGRTRRRPPHYGFLLESLRDLYRDLRQLGGQLQVVTGEVPRFSRACIAAPLRPFVFPRGNRQRPGYRRDRAVKRWCQAQRGLA